MESLPCSILLVQCQMEPLSNFTSSLRQQHRVHPKLIIAGGGPAGKASPAKPQRPHSAAVKKLQFMNGFAIAHYAGEVSFCDLSFQSSFLVLTFFFFILLSFRLFMMLLSSY